MGTPAFAVPSLRILLDNGYEVAAVVTATDKLGGRGKKQVIRSAVKQFAQEKGIRVLQPKNLKSPEFLDQLRALDADLQIVVAFRMLPKAVWDMPPLGTFNLHASLLPKYRGAAPINWAIIKGEKETGLTTFFINENIDTGDILRQVRLKIGPHETAGELHDRMMETGAGLVLQTVKSIQEGAAHPVRQAGEEASSAPKIFHETCRIDFNRPGQEVHDFIRGLSPYPSAWTVLDDKELKVLRASWEKGKPPRSLPGDILTDNKTHLSVAVPDGIVHLLEIKMEGKRKMKVRDFLNGYSISEKNVGG